MKHRQLIALSILLSIVSTADAKRRIVADTHPNKDGSWYSSEQEVDTIAEQSTQQAPCEQTGQSIENLQTPNMSNEALLEWVSQSLASLNQYDHVHYREQIQRKNDLFTDSGFDVYLKHLNSTGNLRAVQEKRLLVNSVPIGVPVIVDRKLVNQRYMWRVKMPVVVSYLSATEHFSQTTMIFADIVRHGTVSRPMGVAIQQIAFRSKANEQ